MKSQFRALGAGLLLSCAMCGAALADDVTYSYDALGRLTRVEYAGGSSVVYNYDAAGNRTTVVYNGTNGSPVASPDSVSTTLGRAVTFDPRFNDSDPDNDPLTISSINTPTAAQHAASLTNNSGQTLTYTPVATFPTGASGTDTFSYAISDGHGHTATSTVTMTVTDRPPTAVADTVAVSYNTQKTFLPMGNDSDPDGDTLTITSPTATAITTSLGGSVYRSNKNLIYTPPANTSGTDTFNYTISDGHTNTATATETMNIGVANRAPTAGDDGMYFGQTLTPPNRVTPIITIDPRLNDSDPDGDPLTVTAVTQPTSGISHASFTSTSITYSYPTSVSNLEMTDSFTYTISDGQGHTATANVNVTIEVESGT